MRDHRTSTCFKNKGAFCKRIEGLGLLQIAQLLQCCPLLTQQREKTRNVPKLGTWGRVLSWDLDLGLSLVFPMLVWVKPHNYQVILPVHQLEASLLCKDRAEAGGQPVLPSLPWVYPFCTFTVVDQHWKCFPSLGCGMAGQAQHWPRFDLPSCCR